MSGLVLTTARQFSIAVLAPLEKKARNPIAFAIRENKTVGLTPNCVHALFRQVVLLKVRPYYLHHPELAPGTSHFRVPIEVAQELMRVLRGRLSGLCLPTVRFDQLVA